MDQLAQFRQIGVPDSRQTNAEVKRCLKRAQRRTETLLNRSTLPQASSLLGTLSTLQQLTKQAYESLPMRRLSLLSDKMSELYDSVERDSFFGVRPNGNSAVALRQFHRELTQVLNQMRAPAQPKRQAPDDKAKQKIKKFLEQAADRGWKVRDEEDVEYKDEMDGFTQSLSYVKKVSTAKDCLLPIESDIGVIHGASLILIPDRSIPDSVLLSWTQPPLELDVYVVFGRYIVISRCACMGVKPFLALTMPDKKPDPKRFMLVANYLDGQGVLDRKHLIQHPKRVRNHYYCPLLGIPSSHHTYFRSWDLLLEK